MILGADHRPQPPSEIVARLRQVDPGLGLTFCPGAFWQERLGRMVDSWAITEAWRMDDPRYRRVQAGEIDGDHCFDILTFLPADCSVDEAFGYFVGSCQRNRGKAGVNDLLNRVHTYNAQQKIRNLAPETELAEELITTSRHRIRSDAVGKHKVETKAKQAKRLLEYLDQ